MSEQADAFEADDAGQRPPPSWVSLRIGVPIAIIAIGLALGVLWKSHVGVLARATVRLGGQRYELRLVEDHGGLYGSAESTEGGSLRQFIAALDRAQAIGGPALARQEIRDAAVVVDRQRREARFLLKRGEIVFDRVSFSLRGVAAQAAN
ncbi:MAG TPA: hypothetical protein VMV10_15970 [Pirellulales bacterium]|nr:hypothetical protein [Pirellulales bacterium]